MLRVCPSSSKLAPAELSARRLCSRVDLWRHRGGMSYSSTCRCVCQSLTSRDAFRCLRSKISGWQTFGRECHEHIVHDGIHKFLQCIMQIPATPISPHAKPETKPPTQTEDSQFWFGQLMKCNFFDLVAATPDAMVDTPLRSLIVCHNTKATNS